MSNSETTSTLAADSPAAATGAAATTAAASAVTPKPVVTISKDKMLAELRFKQTELPTAVLYSQIVDAIASSGLPALSDSKLIELFGETDPVQLAPVTVISQGIPAVDDIPSRVDLLVHDDVFESDNGSASHYDRHAYLTAAAGQHIAKIHPRVPGSDGQDVFGQIIAPAHPPDQKVSLGANITFSEEDGHVTAQCAGRVRFDNGKLCVEPLLDIPGNVDFSVGNIDFACDVHVHRNVLDLFQIKSRQNVIIDGLLEAASVFAGGDLVARGGIVGKEKGHCWAGGNVELKFATNVTIAAHGNVIGKVEIASSNVTCSGSVDVHDGVIVGGTVHGRAGILVGTLGSDSGTRTLVEAGTDPRLKKHVLARLRELREIQKKAQHVREVAAPLMQNQKFLMAGQKQELVEHVTQIRAFEAKASVIVKEIRDEMIESRDASKSVVEVVKRVYPGVTIRFSEVECTIDEVIPGPVKFVPRMTAQGLKVCALHMRGGVVRPLNSHVIIDEYVLKTAVHALGITIPPPPPPTPNKTAVA